MPFIAFFEPVNHATQRNNWPAPPSALALMADFDAVLVRSLAMPATPSATEAIGPVVTVEVEHPKEEEEDVVEVVDVEEGGAKQETIK